MKKYLLVLFILVSFITYGQSPIKVKNQIMLYGVFNWPDSSNYVVKWFPSVKNGLLLTFPYVKNEKGVRLVDFFMKEKQGRALITKYPKNTYAFYVEPIAEKIHKNNNQLALEVWAKFSSSNLLIPVPIDSTFQYIYDSQGLVIPNKIKWQKMAKEYQFENGYFVLGTTTFGVNVR